MKSQIVCPLQTFSADFGLVHAPMVHDLMVHDLRGRGPPQRSWTTVGITERKVHDLRGRGPLVGINISVSGQPPPGRWTGAGTIQSE